MSRNMETATDSQDQELQADAELAARGDESALDRLFAQLGGSAWAVAFSGADAVSPAAEAVADGFTETLHLFDNGLEIEDIHAELLHATRVSALAHVTGEKGDFGGANARHAREPLSLLGETKDRQATLAFTALSEPMRSALWLVEAERFSISRAARLLDKDYESTEALLRDARVAFRKYYVEAVRRQGLDAECTSTLDKLAAYVSKSLNAGETAAVEQHLSHCNDCRSIVAKLEDLEGRLRAAIPPVAVWTRQLVADHWTELTPTPEVMEDDVIDLRDEPDNADSEVEDDPIEIIVVKRGPDAMGEHFDRDVEEEGVEEIAAVEVVEEIEPLEFEEVATKPAAFAASSSAASSPSAWSQVNNRTRLIAGAAAVAAVLALVFGLAGGGGKAKVAKSPSDNVAPVATPSLQAADPTTVPPTEPATTAAPSTTVASAPTTATPAAKPPATAPATTTPPTSTPGYSLVPLPPVPIPKP